MSRTQRPGGQQCSEREWDGLVAHRDYPMISLDNNAAKRMIRGPVVTRKNAGGSRNEDSPGSPPRSGPSPRQPRWPA